MLKILVCWCIVTNGVGVLLSKPDGVVGGNQNTHNASIGIWQGKLLKLVCLWIKHGQSIVAHLPKPDMPLQVNDRAHDSTPWLRKVIFCECPLCISAPSVLSLILVACCVYRARSTGSQQVEQEQ